MTNHFINNLSFKNFKCFKELTVNNIKRVNLIGGKNNIGKTSFMEGLELSVSSEDIIDLSLNIYEMIKRRQSGIGHNFFELDFLYENTLETELVVNDHEIKINYLEEVPRKEIENENDDLSDNFVLEYNPSLKLSVEKKERILSIEKILRSNRMVDIRRLNKLKSKVNFITSNTIDEKTISILYGSFVRLDKEDLLNNYLNLFDENFISLKQIATERGVILRLSLKNREESVLLSSLGEGVNRFIAILAGIWSSKNAYLFIDEIENGIHYTNYEKLWNLIFQISKEANCQVFVTTHSKECMQAFNKVNEENEGNYFEFYRNKKTDLITTKQRNHEELGYSLKHNGRNRGE